MKKEKLINMIRFSHELNCVNYISVKTETKKLAVIYSYEDMYFVVFYIGKHLKDAYFFKRLQEVYNYLENDILEIVK